MTGGPTADELSEYNIQIPDPIIDSKLKIYPVTENTITAEGNLITRPYPEQVFNSRDELNEFIAEFARDNGFGVVIAHSNKKAIYYTCELGGRYRHKKQKIDVTKQIDVGDGYMLDPDTKTKKLKCPFAMTASYKKSANAWTLRTTCNEHNHPQLNPLSNHPMLRKRSDELNVMILEMYKLGTKPSHIESKIKEEYPDVLIKREDIYNEIRGYKRKLKKQNSRFGFHNPSRISAAQYRKKAAAAAAAQAAQAVAQVGTDGPNTADVDAVAAVAAAASANAFYKELLVIKQLLRLVDQFQQQQQQNNNNKSTSTTSSTTVTTTTTATATRRIPTSICCCYSAQAAAAAQQQLDESQYQHYQQQLQEHGLNDTDGTAAAAIAAVANASRQHHHYHTDNGDLSMDNIDSRLVGE